MTFVFWLSLALSGPFYLRLWGSMYPARIRGRLVGLRDRSGLQPPRWPRSPAASSPTSSAG